jgi:hypothetical protein
MGNTKTTSYYAYTIRDDEKLKFKFIPFNIDQNSTRFKNHKNWIGYNNQHYDDIDFVSDQICECKGLKLIDIVRQNFINDFNEIVY